MSRCKPSQSVVARLIACLVIGGVAISAALSVLEYQRSANELRLQLSQRLALRTHNLQDVLRHLVAEPHRERIVEAVRSFTADYPVDAVRLAGPGLEPITLGAWRKPAGADGAASAQELEAHHWSLEEHAGPGGGIAMDRPTLVRAPFTHDRQRYEMTLRVDGPAAYAQVRRQMIEHMAMQWLLLAAMLLLALFLVRRWFIGPLGEMVELIDRGHGPEPLSRLARRHPGEFGRLADAMATMLRRIESTRTKLTQRERAFHSLYEFAPTAMLSVDPAGRVTQANRRAATMFGAASSEALLGQEATALVSEHDQPRLQQAIRRLDVDEDAHCELQLASHGDEPRHAAIEAAALRDESGALTAVRLAFVDVTEWRRLRRELEEKTRVLNLVIDHMSDAILLVDQHQRIVAFNRRLAELVQRTPATLHGARYDRQRFWEPMGALDPAALTDQLARVEAEPHRSVQERIETHKGVFQLQSMVLHDAMQAPVGRLWVVRETTSQEQNQRLLRQQHEQLGALRQVSVALSRARDVDEVLESAADQLHRLLGVEAVGLILRNRASLPRCRQVIHRGVGTLLLEPHRAVAGALERELVPMVLSNDDVALWPDVPHDADWGRALQTAGLTSIAAGPLRGPHETVGIAWVARRGGERLERHHLHLLETLIPSIAARVQIVELEARLANLALTDGEAALPGCELFDRALERMSRDHDQLAVLVFELERFDPELDRHRRVGSTATVQAAVRRLQEVCRRSTFIARLGRSQLGLIVPAVDAPVAEQMAGRLHNALAEAPVELADGRRVALAVSVGVACGPTATTDPAALQELALGRADLARRSGRGVTVGHQAEEAAEPEAPGASPRNPQEPAQPTS